MHPNNFLSFFCYFRQFKFTCFFVFFVSTAARSRRISKMQNHTDSKVSWNVWITSRNINIKKSRCNVNRRQYDIQNDTEWKNRRWIDKEREIMTRMWGRKKGWIVFIKYSCWWNTGAGRWWLIVTDAAGSNKQVRENRTFLYWAATQSYN